jgi:Tfp pilus assembly major pilin PilA
MQRGRIEEMAIIVVPTVLGEIQLFLYLRYKKRSLLLTTKKKGGHI